jgi:hypothetical protein
MFVLGCRPSRWRHSVSVKKESVNRFEQGVRPLVRRPALVAAVGVPQDRAFFSPARKRLVYLG